MQASVMISSVVNDSIPCGDLELLKEFWTDHDGLAVRLKVGKKPKDVDFDAIREEIRRHLKRKYGFKAWIFEKEFGSGHNPAEEIVLQVKSAHLVIAVFGSRVGFKVGDQDPLTPTLREWRAALETPLKFRLFRFSGSLPADQLAGELGTLMSALTGFKMGSGYLQFDDTAQLLLLIDETVQKYLNDAVVRYARDAVAKTPNEEAETWALTSFRRRCELMQDSLKTIAAGLGAQDGMLRTGKYVQPICLQSVPDSFGSADARKFVSYVFDDVGTDRSAGDPGRLAIIACFKGVTDGQIRRFMGNVERIEVYPSTWGFYAADRRQASRRSISATARTRLQWRRICRMPLTGLRAVRLHCKGWRNVADAYSIWMPLDRPSRQGAPDSFVSQGRKNWRADSRSYREQGREHAHDCDAYCKQDDRQPWRRATSL